MTISVSTNEQTFLGNGVTTAFDFTIIMGTATNAQIIYVDTAGVQTTLLPSQYTLAINPPAVGQIWGVGGTVTYSLGGTPIPSGSYLIVARIVPLTQTVSISNQGDFFPKAVETALDNLEMQIQQVASSVTGNIGPDLSEYYVNADGSTSTLGSFYGDFLLLAQNTGNIYCPTVGGTANAITLTPSTPFAAYVEGQQIAWLVAATNTDSVTINVSDLGDVDLLKDVNTALALGDLPIGAYVTAKYDGTNFQLDYSRSKFPTIQITSSINDTNNNEVIKIGTVSSAVNEVTTTNAATGNNPSIAATGDDTNISLNLVSKGTGKILFYGVAPEVSGQCRLTKSGSNLVLSPFNGNNLIINGQFYAIPSAGVSLAPSGLTSSTIYYIYAYINSSTMTLEASTTAHSTDTTTGVEIKTGDASRTLVGMAWATGATTWGTGNADVASWFNRRPITVTSSFTAFRSTSSTSPVEVNSEIRTNFLTWADYNSTYVGAYSGSTTPQSITSLLTLDGSSYIAATNYNVTSASFNVPLTHVASENTTEGRHYVTIFGSVSTGTASWLSTATLPACGVLRTTILI